MREKEAQDPVRVAYERRNRDLDPQLVWRGKDEQDWSDLVVHAPPLYIQEKVHPKALIDEVIVSSRPGARRLRRPDSQGRLALATRVSGQMSRRARPIEANGSLRSAGSRGESEAIQMNRGGPADLQSRVPSGEFRSARDAYFHSRACTRRAPRSDWRGEPSRVDRS